jgi:hypothetical protein
MSKANFTKRQAALRSRMQAIEDQLRSEADISACARLEAECDRLCDEIVVLEQAQLNSPARSRHAIAVKLGIIADRARIGLETDTIIDRLKSQINEWRQHEPILFDRT